MVQMRWSVRATWPGSDQISTTDSRGPSSWARPPQQVPLPLVAAVSDQELPMRLRLHPSPTTVSPRSWARPMVATTIASRWAWGEALRTGIRLRRCGSIADG
jgi:hypothetical protein